MSNTFAVPSMALQGEFTIFNAAAIREQILACMDGACELEIDLSQVIEIDSAGMQLMVSAKKEAAAQGIVLHYTGHSPAVQDLLDLCDLSAILGDPVLIHSRSDEEHKP